MNPPPENSTESTHCLYFLVSAATTGPQAGLFKLGISSDLAARHRTHTNNWEGFDLVRSALVRVKSRGEAQRLETTLRQHFSNPDAEAEARAAGQPLSSADLAALNSCRRHPGRQADGWTEFFAVEFMEKMLEAAEYLLTCSGHRIAGTGVQRGITLPAQTVAAKRQSDTPKRAPSKRAVLRPDFEVRQAREEQELRERTAIRTAQLLKLVLDYEAHVVWVDLSWWQHLLRHGGFRSSQGRALADVYFGEFAPASAKARDKWALPPLTRASFAKCVAPIVDWTCSPDPDDWMRKPPGAICCLDEIPNFYGKPPPHPACVGAPRIRFDPWPFDVCIPFLAQFEALARRVESRGRDEQSDPR